MLTLHLAGVVDAVKAGDTDGQRIGTRIVLPATFINGPRYLHKIYQNAMAIAREYGKPDLFITFTCNPKWPEIERELRKDAEGRKLEEACDRPGALLLLKVWRGKSPIVIDLYVRVFQAKLKQFLKYITKPVKGHPSNKPLFGRVVARVHVIEFQKRGLPHAHILLILDGPDKPRTPDDYDHFVRAELPDKEKEPRLYKLVVENMLHGPCGANNDRSPCMVDGKCTKRFPKSFQEARCCFCSILMLFVVGDH